MPQPRQSEHPRSSLPAAKEAEIRAFVQRIYDRYADDASSDELAGALSDALRERLRVNVGLLMEIDELKRQR